MKSIIISGKKRISLLFPIFPHLLKRFVYHYFFLHAFLFLVLILISASPAGAETKVKVAGTESDTYVVYRLYCDSPQFPAFCGEAEERVGDSKTIPAGLLEDADGVKITDDLIADPKTRSFFIKLNNVIIEKNKSSLGEEWVETTQPVLVFGRGIDTYFVFDEDGKLGSATTNQYKDMFPGTFTIALNKTEKTGISPPSFLFSGSVIVLGRGVDQFSVFLADDPENSLISAETGDEKEFFDGDYIVSLNKTVQNVTLGTTRVLLDSAAIIVNGTGDSSYFVYDGDTELGSKETSEYFELFPGTYTIRLNNTEKTLDATTIFPGINTLDAGGIHVHGEGSDSFEVAAADGESLGTEKTGTPFEIFEGSYTITLNTLSKDLSVSPGPPVEVPAGWIIGNGTGNTMYTVYTADGTKLASKKTDENFCIYADTYTIDLHGVTEEKVIADNIGVPLFAGSFVVTGKAIDDYNVHNSSDEMLKQVPTNDAIDLYAENYIIKLNNVEKNISITNGQHMELAAGSVLIEGTGDNQFSITDKNHTPLVSKFTREEAELFPGDYIAILNNTQKNFSVNAGNITELPSGSLLVTGNGDANYYVYTLDEEYLGFAKTGKVIELFTGDYLIRLNNMEVVRTVEEGGNQVVVSPGGILVAGEGQSEYGVYSPAGAGNTTKVAEARTGETITLMPGDYQVRLNGIAKDVTVSDGEVLDVATGTLLVEGLGEDDYFVYDTAGNPLGFARTGESMELFAGTYVVELNGTSRTVEIRGVESGARAYRENAGGIALGDVISALLVCSGSGKPPDTNPDIIFDGTITMEDAISGLMLLSGIKQSTFSVLKAGALLVQGRGIDNVFVDDFSGAILAIRKTNRVTELFPGQYGARLNNVRKQLRIGQLQTTTLETGRLTVEGSGMDYWNAYSTNWSLLRGNIATNTRIELYPGDYQVEKDGKTQSATVLSGELRSIGM